MEEFKPLLFGEGEEELDKILLYMVGKACLVALAICAVVYLFN